MRAGFKGRIRAAFASHTPQWRFRMSPTPSPLTAAQRGVYEAKLVARRLALRAEIEAKLNTQDNPALMGLRNRMEETDDWAVADLETALDVAEVSRDAAELQEVEAALTRIKGGTYGNCIECGMPIPPTRLDVAPMSARCIACQEKVETAMRRAGAGTL
jgi:RNA polymerase-binding transcription factor DksA